MIERDDLRFVAHVPDQVHLKVEFEIEDDGTELEIELARSDGRVKTELVAAPDLFPDLGWHRPDWIRVLPAG